MIAILMGVTGSGKTTVAEALMHRTGWRFAEGDDYHPAANKAKMHAGQELTDEDRAPWLAALHGVLERWVREGTKGVMTCSALKESYRRALVDGLPEGAARFVLLEVPRSELEERLERRTGHFMNPALLDSQLQTLEVPGDAVHVRAVGDPGAVAEAVMEGLGIARRARSSV